jgi:hypothetical protein
MINYQAYLDEKLHQLRVVCQTQWDFLKYNEVSKWIEDNFANDTEGQYYATKILLHTVYYSKKDLIKLLSYGLNERIYGKIIKDDLIAKQQIFISPSEAESLVVKFRKKSFFIPLLDSNKPSESGNGVVGDLVHKLDIKESQVAFQRDVSEEILADTKFLIFVDDCVGSGSQLKKFWNSAEIVHIKEICQKLDIKIYYLVLIGYRKNLQKLIDNNELTGIEVIVCDLLTESNRVFSNENIIWDKETDEIGRVIKYFENLSKTKGVQFLGFKKLDFAVILHDRLPNWSLPIFWKKSSSWQILLKRKTSI